MNRAGKKQYGNWIIRDEIVTTLLDIFFSLPPTNPIDQFLKTTETYALCLPYVCQILFFFYISTLRLHHKTRRVKKKKKKLTTALHGYRRVNVVSQATSYSTQQWKSPGICNGKEKKFKHLMPQRTHQGNRAECKGENASKRRAHAKMQDGNCRGKLDGCVTLRPLVLTWRPGKPVLYICRKYAQKKTSTYMGSLRWLQQRRFSCSKQGFSPAFCFPRDNIFFRHRHYTYTSTLS